MASVSNGTDQREGDGGLVDQASSKAQEAAQSVQEKAGELKEQGRSRLGEQLDTRTTEAGREIRSLAEALRSSGDQMRQHGSSGRAPELTAAAADRVERLGDYLERTTGNDVFEDVEQFARRRPWLIAGMAAAAGFAASRLLKASSESRYERQTGSYRYRPEGASYAYGTGSADVRG